MGDDDDDDDDEVCGGRIEGGRTEGDERGTEGVEQAAWERGEKKEEREGEKRERGERWATKGHLEFELDQASSC